MRVLITGGSGLLGKSLIETRKPQYEIFATYVGEYTLEDLPDFKYKKLDIRDYDGYNRLFQEFNPDVVIHTAGVGSPDFAEQHREETWDINVGGTLNILALCKKFSSRLVYISSNGIYDGEKAPYGEEDEPEPINYYGELKLEAEKALKNCSIPCAVIRPILMYGWNHPFERPSIATYALKVLENGSSVHVYDDVFITPLFSIECGKAIWTIIREEKYDVFNIAGAERVSIYQMVVKMAEIFGLDKNLILPVQQGFFNKLVKRPQDTSYRTVKMQEVLGIEPLSLYEGFTAMKNCRM